MATLRTPHLDVTLPNFFRWQCNNAHKGEEETDTFRRVTELAGGSPVDPTGWLRE